MPIRRSIVALACATLALSMPVREATAQTGGRLGASEKVLTATNPPAVQLLDVEFRGGTLEEFVTAIRAAANPEPVNVVLLGRAGELPVPAVTLRRVTAESAFRAVCSRSMARVDSLDSGGDPIITIETDPGSATRQASVGRATGGRQSSVGSEVAVLRVYSVRDFVDGKSVTYSTVLDALRTALSADEVETRAEVLHHEASGVLIVRGTIEQQNVAEQVLDAIRTDARVGEQAQQVIDGERLVLKQRLRTAEIEVGRAAVELDAAMENLAHVSKLSEGDFVAETELLAAKRSAELARLQREQAEVQLQALAAQLQALDKKSGGATRSGDAPEFETRVVDISVSQTAVAAKLLHVIHEVLSSTGARGSITVVKMTERPEGPTGTLAVEFTGPAEAMDHFQALCKLVTELEQRHE